LRYLLRLLRAALQDAVEEELLARNVARQVKMPTGSIRKVTPWSADEARTFLETARYDRLYALWAVALAIGLRRGKRSGFGGPMWTWSTDGWLLRRRFHALGQISPCEM
jgi:integrase